jgi:CRISPR-associated endonuclease/helicase Cas3
VPAPRRVTIRDDAAIAHESCWAKTKEDGTPGINVLEHCLNVGCVAESLIALLPSPLTQMLPRGTATLAALHDVGKLTPGFQVKCATWLDQHHLRERAAREGWSQQESDHAKISQGSLQSLFKDTGLYAWAAAAGAHHGRLKGLRVAGSGIWEDERQRLAAAIIEILGPLPDVPPADAAVWLVAGLISVADWIGSDEENFPQGKRWSRSERCGQARDSLLRVGWQRAPIRPLSGFTELFPEIQTPNSLQRTVVEAVREPGVYVIEGPMGCGKTEAALAAAYEILLSGSAHGLYFALPTQLTSDRIYRRVQSFVARIADAAVRLAHANSWLIEAAPPIQLRASVRGDHEGEEHVRAGRDWFASAKRALLMQFGVGTVDQALLGIVAAKHFFVRQFGLAGKVVVLDEVHTYDVYTGTLISLLVKRLRELGSTVIILSATLTKQRRRELLGYEGSDPLSDAYPLLSGKATASFFERACEPLPSMRYGVRTVAGPIPVREPWERADRGECVLWIRNTVSEAQETFRLLRRAAGGNGPVIGLLHSRFPFFRREQLEDEWMERLGKDSARRPPGCVLVSTQVAEQSVDIDADFMVTDLAPTDMLLQRLGRVWRHERLARHCAQPEVWIQGPSADEGWLRSATAWDLRKALGKSAKVYAPYVLLRSLALWRCREAITIPGEIRGVLEATYAETADEPPAWRELRTSLEEEKERMARMALTAASVWAVPALGDEEGVQTRLNDRPTAQLLLVQQVQKSADGSTHLHLLDGEKVKVRAGEWSFAAAKAMHRNLVRLPRWAALGGLKGPPTWLTNHFASVPALGVVSTDGSIVWPGFDGPTGLAYDPDEGVIINSGIAARQAGEVLDEPNE